MSARDEELIDIMAEEALMDRSKLDPSAKLEDIGLDSVDLVSVVFAIEEKYGIEIAEDAFDRTDTLAVVLQKINALIDAKDSGAAPAAKPAETPPTKSGDA